MGRNYLQRSISRRRFLQLTLAGAALVTGGFPFSAWPQRPDAHVFIGKAASYQLDLVRVLLDGFRELKVPVHAISGKRIFLKPNLVESHQGQGHINTHPLLIRAAIEALFHLGAKEVLVGEGPGHRWDTLQIIDQSGLVHVLQEDKIPFVDLNRQEGVRIKNLGEWTSLATLTFPAILGEVDWIISMPKLKTHHWAGVTLSMKNLFGVMPGMYYGWPKNVLHQEGIHPSILDITATLQPDFVIADGIVGMEGDGPIMGTPKPLGIIVMGQNLPAVDSTCCRAMGIDPNRIGYLAAAEGWLGPLSEDRIGQRGENISDVRKNFSLVSHIPAHDGLRLP